MTIEALRFEVRACTICREHLPLGPRPLFQLDSRARILIAGQAPGRRAHESGIPFDDPSGQRLRDWMGIRSNQFYDSTKIAILPMGMCFPGSGKSGDLPPRPECAVEWRARLLRELQNVELTLVIGRYAIAYHLDHRYRSITEAVRSWQSHWPKLAALPHPSPRNNPWLARNYWFEAELLPRLKQRVGELLVV
jgi:uracil-DNA glycosylase